MARSSAPLISMSFSRVYLPALRLLIVASSLQFTRTGTARSAQIETVEACPREAPDALLHNPDMGWVLYENYPLDQNPQGSSTLLALPNESFPQVDAVAIMFSWQDVEKRPGIYDFSKVDHAYGYWANRGKAIQLRLSACTLVWWTGFDPPTGKGVPDYVRDHLPSTAKQVRQLEGRSYDVEDARDPFYRERLTAFLNAVDKHFAASRPVTLIDLRGFGIWGEWHSGFRYASLAERRQALRTVIDTWTEALPSRRLALSASYDPDGPKELYEGTTRKFNLAATSHYHEFLGYSAFDYALNKPNLTFRRDGCGGAVHSNERKLIEEAFQRGRGPIACEFVDGYGASKAGGQEWVAWKIEDALSLHPNYINVLGWQGSDMLAFMHERADLIDRGLRRMGYRFVPTAVRYPASVKTGEAFRLDSQWVNRAVGRALRDYELQLLAVDKNDRAMAISDAGKLQTSGWIVGRSYSAANVSKFNGLPPGEYRLAIRLWDATTRRCITLPLAEGGPGSSYVIGNITFTP